MNYVISAVVVNYAYKYSQEQSYNYIRNKTMYYSWYIIKFPFVYTYNKVFKTNTDNPIDDDYEVVGDD